MNKRFLLLSILLLSLLLPEQEVEGWGRRRRRFRLRRIVRRVRVRKVVCWIACHVSCGYVCKANGVCNFVCRRICRRVCNGKKKREISDASSFSNEVMSDELRVSGAFPSSLSAYDKDKDGKISRKEFARVASFGSRPDQEENMAFNMCDRNGDSFIDCQEFKVCQLLFKKKPTC